MYYLFIFLYKIQTTKNMKHQHTKHIQELLATKKRYNPIH